jgi:hypothetical protein
VCVCARALRIPVRPKATTHQTYIRRDAEPPQRRVSEWPESGAFNSGRPQDIRSPISGLRPSAQPKGKAIRWADGHAQVARADTTDESAQLRPNAQCPIKSPCPSAPS